MRIKHSITVDLNELPALLSSYLEAADPDNQVFKQLSSLISDFKLSAKDEINFNVAALNQKIEAICYNLKKVDLCLEEISDIFNTLIDFENNQATAADVQGGHEGPALDEKEALETSFDEKLEASKKIINDLKNLNLEKILDSAK